MCGRYAETRSAQDLSILFETDGPAPNFPPRWNAAPTQDMPVIRRHPESGRRVLSLLRWGLVPHFGKGPKDGPPLINARVEGLSHTRPFMDAFRRRRCLVPADAYYEWSEDRSQKRQTHAVARQAHAVARKDRAPFAFAGLWEGWRGADGTIVRSFTIVTTAACPSLATVHSRMPVILAPDDWSLWLGEAGPDDVAMGYIPRGLPDTALAIWAVSNRVGSVRHDDATLLEPLTQVETHL